MKLKSFTLPITWLIGIETGWGNGYVIIPKGHPLHSVDYNDIDNIDVHGGITFSSYVADVKKDYKNTMYLKVKNEDPESWILGFDCAHFCDNIQNCSKAYVIAETKRFKKQLEKLTNKI